MAGRLRIACFVRAAAVALFVVAGPPAPGASPSIVITNLPAYGSTDLLAGEVAGVNPAACAVAVFIEVPPWGWWTKPTCAQSLTSIRPDGSWSASITTGGSDTNAARIAAFLVPATWSQTCVLGDANLSTNLYSQALASAVVLRPVPGVRWIRFSGYDWWVKDYSTLAGPGPNYFSSSFSNVWTDAEGRLHLRISNRSNQWQCAEVATGRTFGYGSYRFEVETAVDGLDPNVVLGLFTWSDDPAWENRQIDIECSRWSAAGDTNNSQFVVSPYYVAGHLVRYRVPPPLKHSTHLWTWESNRIAFQCQSGSYDGGPVPTNVIAAYAFTNAAEVLRTGDETARINLWLFGGQAPADGREAECIIRSFQFVPLGAPAPATLKPSSQSGAADFKFLLEGQFDRLYEVEASTNLHHWQSLGAVLATNLVLTVQDTNPVTSVQRYYRTLTAP
ncbi:MAG: glycoside hydrolase family 16 protein [Verrucomicrobiota bacterium]